MLLRSNHQRMFEFLTDPRLQGVAAIATIVGVILAFVTLGRRNKEKDRNDFRDASKQIIEEEQKQRVEEGKERPKPAFLRDVDNIMSLNIENDFLTQLYNEALTMARTSNERTYHDAELQTWWVEVWPFSQHCEINLFFVAPFGKRKIMFKSTNLGRPEHCPPDREARANQLSFFKTLPWESRPNWRHFVARAYEKASPLSEDSGSHYRMIVDADGRWDLAFSDGTTGDVHEFGWRDGPSVGDESIVKKG